MPYLPEFEPPFVISTQNIMFMALQQAAAAGVELAQELQDVVETYDVQTQSNHPEYVNLLHLLNNSANNNESRI